MGNHSSTLFPTSNGRCRDKLVTLPQHFWHVSRELSQHISNPSSAFFSRLLGVIRILNNVFTKFVQNACWRGRIKEKTRSTSEYCKPSLIFFSWSAGIITSNESSFIDIYRTSVGVHHDKWVTLLRHFQHVSWVSSQQISNHSSILFPRSMKSSRQTCNAPSTLFHKTNM